MAQKNEPSPAASFFMAKLESLLKDASDNNNLWIPGLQNGIMEAWLKSSIQTDAYIELQKLSTKDDTLTTGAIAGIMKEKQGSMPPGLGNGGIVEVVQIMNDHDLWSDIKTIVELEQENLLKQKILSPEQRAELALKGFGTFFAGEMVEGLAARTSCYNPPAVMNTTSPFVHDINPLSATFAVTALAAKGVSIVAGAIALANPTKGQLEALVNFFQGKAK